MKILSVYNRYLNRGGEDEVFESEAELLRQHGVEVGLVTEQVTSPDSLQQKVAAAIQATWSNQWYKRFQALLESEAPDLVHVHNLVPTISPSVLYACQRAGIPVVHTLHNYRLFCPTSTFFRDGHLCEECLRGTLWQGVKHGCYRDSRLATAALAGMLAIHRNLGTWSEKVDCYVALTQFARQKFIEGGLPADRIVIKPNFVEPDPGVGNGDGGYCVFVGRLAAQKGVSAMLAAWHRLSGVKLIVVGNGPLASEVESAGRSSCVHYLGRLPRNQTLEVIKQARALVFPSEWYEGFPLTIAEAFACGVPVICSRLGAMQEIVEDCRTGLHFEAGNADDLAAKVTWAWNHPAEVRAMGTAARSEYESKYTARRNYEMLFEIYQQTLRRRRNALNN